ncbi:MAG: FAD-binding oxidoreductase [Actinomycetota bacterium]|nr:FAD-binding oxidoreductase [Actinomycetota bacterium]
MRTEQPTSAAEAADAIRTASEQGARVRLRGGGTKLGWGHVSEAPDLELSTSGLQRIVEHSRSDLTAVLQAGVRLAEAQEEFGRVGQMLAVDPPLGEGESATVGGVLATADSGPLRHQYKAPRDLLLGASFCLADGTLAKAGSKVIKNVAGYDLPKLFCGSFGTLGLIVEVSVRLHPIPLATTTAVGESGDPDALERAVLSLSRSTLVEDCLDVAWDGEEGMVLARYGGAAPGDRARRSLDLLAGAGLEARLEEDDEGIWERQRAGQRSAAGAVVRVSGLPGELSRVLRVARKAGASVVGRAGLGISWMRLEEADPVGLVSTIEELRRKLAPFPCVVLDAPEEVRRKLDPWGEPNGGLPLMRRIKARFDPSGTCNPGLYVGGI